MDLAGSIEGAILGTAVGDAVGLPREGLSRRRARRLFGGRPLRYRFLFSHGMVSDDAEHTCMVAQALLKSGGEVGRFARSLAWRLRWWFLGLPAGIGAGTLRAILKLWLGWGPNRSGVHSAGNGPVMRSAILGLYAQDDIDHLKALVKASTRLTHTDPRAEQGALAVALAARFGARHGPEGIEPRRFLADLREHVEGEELWGALAKAEEFLLRGVSAEEYADALGLAKGIGGYVNHTVPACLYCWLRQPRDFRAAVEEVILLGGDADTTGAVVGALAGATLGPSAIPDEWLTGLLEWPRTVPWMRRLAHTLARAVTDPQADPPPKPVRLFWPALPLRNLLFGLTVLLHALRRLLPPY